MKIIQMFNWSLKDIESELHKIKEQGFTHIQTSPLQGCKDKYTEWWKLYQPVNFKIGNFIGNKEDLTNLCNEAQKIGLKIIADVVLRHVATDNFNCDKPHQNVDSELLPYIIHRPRLYNENNREDVVNCSCGMPMLDYENPQLQIVAKRYLDELKSCGVDMFRLDMAKHYRLPSEGGTFLSNVMSNYDWIGEVLFEENQGILYQYSQICYVFSMNSLPDKSKMVLGVECHDTFLNDDGVGYTKRMNSETIVKEYGIVSSYATNTMFYTRPYDDSWKSEIIKVINTEF